MKIEGLFKSSTYQAISSLYFLRISSSLYSSSTVNVADIITCFTFSGPKKAYFKCLSSLHSNLIFLYYSHSNLRLTLLNHFWNSEIHNQDPQVSRNSSHFH